MSASRPGKSKPAIIVISSHVARGSVGNRAAVFALETLSFPVWAVPTVILPHHPGHGRATRIVPDPERFSALLGDLLASPWMGEVAAILTGYMADAGQVAAVADFIAAARAANPNLMHYCDPVIGDDGALYVADKTAAAIGNRLVPEADCITPNRFELTWLAGCDITSADEAVRAVRSLTARSALVTSLPGYMRGNIGNLYTDADAAWFAEHREVPNPPNGPGDLAAALLLARTLAGQEPMEALNHVTAAVFQIVSSAERLSTDELMLEKHAASILRPTAMVQARRIAATEKKPANDSRSYGSN